jgi:predicted nucleic acid-binding Zn ribbon protein
VGSIFEKLGIAEKVGRAAAAARWDEVVGPEISRRTGDVRVSGRALIVEVESSTWMQELNMQRHQILRKLNEGLEGGEIEKIVFVQEGKR